MLRLRLGHVRLKERSVKTAAKRRLTEKHQATVYGFAPDTERGGAESGERQSAMRRRPSSSQQRNVSSRIVVSERTLTVHSVRGAGRAPDNWLVCRRAHGRSVTTGGAPATALDSAWVS